MESLDGSRHHEVINEGSDFHILQTAKGGYTERFDKEIRFEVDHTVSRYVGKF